MALTAQESVLLYSVLLLVSLNRSDLTVSLAVNVVDFQE